MVTRITDLSQYSCPFAKDIKDDNFLYIHPGGYDNLLSAYEVEKGAAQMLFFSYHIGVDINKSYEMGKLLQYELPKQTNIQKEIDEIYKEIIKKYWIHGYIYKLWCIILIPLMFICRFYFIYSPTIISISFTSFITISYASTVYHSRAHCGKYFLTKNYKLMEKLYINCFNFIDSIIILDPHRSWRHKHRKSHHIYTNTTEDNSVYRVYPILRYHTQYPLKTYHKYQWFYSIFLNFLYGFIPKRSKTAINKNKHSKTYEYICTTVHILLIYLIPFYFHGFYPIILLLISRSIGGCFIFYVNHPAHINTGIQTIKYEKDEYFKTYDHWVIGQIERSISFIPQSYFWSLFLGGANCQIEHHIAPNVLPVYYCFIAKHLQNWCEKKNIKYNYRKNWLQLIIGYHRQLFILGNN